MRPGRIDEDIERPNNSKLLRIYYLEILFNLIDLIEILSY